MDLFLFLYWISLGANFFSPEFEKLLKAQTDRSDIICKARILAIIFYYKEFTPLLVFVFLWFDLSNISLKLLPLIPGDKRYAYPYSQQLYIVVKICPTPGT